MTDTAGKAQKPPFFVLGAQRSGTTMLRLMLNNHPNLVIPHETAFITIFHGKLADYGDLSNLSNSRRLLDDVMAHRLVERGKLIPDPKAVLKKPITTYRDFIEAVFRTYAETQGKQRWGDKTPFYTSEVDILRVIFPDCKVIHLVRDGRDVILSQRKMEWMSGNLPKLARDWAWKTTLVHKVGRVLGADFLEVHYEDLVRNPHATLEEICRFLDEPYSPDLLRFAENAECVVPEESQQWHQNSIRPPDVSKLGEWRRKLSKADRIIFEQEAGSALELFGYSREHLVSNWGSRLRKLYYLLFKRR